MSGTRSDNEPFLGFLRRIIRAAGRRVADGDVEALPLLIGARHDLDRAISDAIAGLLDAGFSYAEIAARIGISRQAVHQYHRRRPPLRATTPPPHPTPADHRQPDVDDRPEISTTAS